MVRTDRKITCASGETSVCSAGFLPVALATLEADAPFACFSRPFSAPMAPKGNALNNAAAEIS